MAAEDIGFLTKEELFHDGTTWTLAGVVKSPGLGMFTMNDIPYQITKPAYLDSVDYIVLFNGNKTGSNLSERGRHRIFDVVYVNNYRILFSVGRLVVLTLT